MVSKQNMNIKDKINRLKETYVASMFNTLMKCSDDKQRWNIHAARKAANIYSKSLLKDIKALTSNEQIVCRYLDYAIITFQKLEYSISYAKKRIHLMISPYASAYYEPLTPDELNDCRKFFGSSFVDKVTQDEHSVFNTMMDHSKRREELRAKLPKMEPFFDAWNREREWLNSNHKPTESNVKVLYAEDNYEVEDAFVISESAAKALCETSEDIIRSPRLPDGCHDDYTDRVSQIILDLNKYHLDDETIALYEKYLAEFEEIMKRTTESSTIDPISSFFNSKFEMTEDGHIRVVKVYMGNGEFKDVDDKADKAYTDHLDGTLEGLEKYHAAVAGNGIGFEPRMEFDKEGNPRLISVDLCRKIDNNG